MPFRPHPFPFEQFLRRTTAGGKKLAQWQVCAEMTSVVLWSAELRNLVLRAIVR